jgi:hypothetical protein
LKEIEDELKVRGRKIIKIKYKVRNKRGSKVGF